MYAKRSADLARGKPHGSVDLGLSVISAKRRRCRIDIDAEVFIYHIKVQLTQPPISENLLNNIFFNRSGEVTRRVWKMVRGLERASSIPSASTTHPGFSSEDGGFSSAISWQSGRDEPNGRRWPSRIEQFWHSWKSNAHFTRRLADAELETI